jgi:methyl coenzyme M reductase subunit C
MIMRAREFIIEGAIGTLTIGNITVVVDDHAIEQVRTRKIDPKLVDTVLKKLPTIQDQLSNMESGSKIWIRDPVTDISLGLRRINSNQLRFQFKTAVQHRTYQSDTEEIVLPEKLEELDFMGMSQCTKDCSGHRAGYEWSRARGRRTATSWSPSFNRGAQIAAAGY